MSEEVGLETERVTKEKTIGDRKQAFLKSSDMTSRIVSSLDLQGFQLGGGAVDFVLEEYRRPHSDIDMIYVIQSRSWDDYKREPKSIPDERQSLQNITTEPELFGVEQAKPLAMDRMGAPGVQMQGGELPLVVDFIEAYTNEEDGESFIMLPVYEGRSYIKIPSSEIIEKEIEGVKVNVPSSEVQYLLKEQAAGIKRTLKGGPPPDRRKKAQKDMEDLEAQVDKEKVNALREKGVGFNFSPMQSAKFRATQLFRAISG